MRFISSLILILGIIIGQLKADLILKLRIFNYRNDHNILHDGGKCENFDFLGDHCDPMFEICLSSYYTCDLVSRKIDSWHNQKTIHNVFMEDIYIKNYPKFLSLKVRVDDHDSYDSNDHIVEFSTTFPVEHSKQFYQELMRKTYYVYHISLEASITFVCLDPYYGKNCQYRYNEKECVESCGHGECILLMYLKTYKCECKPGWIGRYCSEYFVNNCSLLNCPKNCAYTPNSKSCVCISSDHYKIHCREFIPLEINTTPNILTPTMSSSTISPKTTTTLKVLESTTYNSTVSTMRKSTNFLSTKTSKNYASSTEIFKLKTTTIKPTTLLLYEKLVTKRKLSSIEISKLNSLITPNKNMTQYGSQIQSETIQKIMDDKIVKVHHSSSTIIIICLLCLLCISIFGLIVAILNGQKRKLRKFNTILHDQRPLPPVLYHRNETTNKPFKSLMQNHLTNVKKSDDDYESCIIGYVYNSEKGSNMYSNNHNFEINDPYEEPIINNMESLTCETDYNDSDHSDIYEVPIKSKLAK